jgi:hypothetical protein
MSTGIQFGFTLALAPGERANLCREFVGPSNRGLIQRLASAEFQLEGVVIV